MRGSISQPAAQPVGFVAKHLSDDGSHFVFGSTSKFEPDGNEGEISIYDRDLVTEETHVVSKTPGGLTMSGPGIGELDISADGSRILIGQVVGEAEGVKRWHLYMNVGDSNQTIDLTPGTTSGVLYDGMSADGTKVFFTTTDQLTGDDEDESADIYEAEIGESGSTLTRVSTGSEGTGNNDLCEPSANTVHEHWNSTGSEANCGVVAVGGGGGVAAEDGTIYFLSPEMLDSSENGVENAPQPLRLPPRAAAALRRHPGVGLERAGAAAGAPIRALLGTFNNPSGVAIDHATGDVYVLEIGTDIGPGTVWKFDSSGHLVLSFGSSGRITVSGELGFYHLPTEIAVDETTRRPLRSFVLRRGRQEVRPRRGTSRRPQYRNPHRRRGRSGQRACLRQQRLRQSGRRLRRFRHRTQELSDDSSTDRRRGRFQRNGLRRKWWRHPRKRRHR